MIRTLQRAIEMRAECLQITRFWLVLDVKLDGPESGGEGRKVIVFGYIE